MKRDENWAERVMRQHADNHGLGPGYPSVSSPYIAGDVLRHLTGGTTETEFLEVADLDNPVYRARLIGLLARASKHPTVVVTSAQVGSGRLLSDQAYTVLSLETGPQGEDAVRLHNPFGSGGMELWLTLEQLVEDASYLQANTPPADVAVSTSEEADESATNGDTA